MSGSEKMGGYHMGGPFLFRVSCHSKWRRWVSWLLCAFAVGNFIIEIPHQTQHQPATFAKPSIPPAPDPSPLTIALVKTTSAKPPVPPDVTPSSQKPEPVLALETTRPYPRPRLVDLQPTIIANGFRQVHHMTL